MPEIYCRICGTMAQPKDIFCRKCGTSLISNTVTEESALMTGIEPGKAGREHRAGLSSLPPARSGCKVWTIGVTLSLFLTVCLMMTFLVFLANLSGGRPAIEFIGTSTPYPTRKPYSTLPPYKTATPYPTAVPYPTTGALATVTPTGSSYDQLYGFSIPSFDSCRLIVKNNNMNLDSVVILFNVETNTIAAAVYVRANDSISESGISTGTYHTYVATGQDWDTISGRFSHYANYFRFKDPVVFDTCPSYGYGFSYGSYQYLEVILNVAEGGEGSDTISVLPGDFPGFTP